jgi:hypothetical protein
MCAIGIDAGGSRITITALRPATTPGTATHRGGATADSGGSRQVGLRFRTIAIFRRRLSPALAGLGLTSGGLLIGETGFGVLFWRLAEMRPRADRHHANHTISRRRKV